MRSNLAVFYGMYFKPRVWVLQSEEVGGWNRGFGYMKPSLWVLRTEKIVESMALQSQESVIREQDKLLYSSKIITIRKRFDDGEHTPLPCASCVCCRIRQTSKLKN